MNESALNLMTRERAGQNPGLDARNAMRYETLRVLSGLALMSLAHDADGDLDTFDRLVDELIPIRDPSGAIRRS